MDTVTHLSAERMTEASFEVARQHHGQFQTQYHKYTLECKLMLFVESESESECVWIGGRSRRRRLRWWGRKVFPRSLCRCGIMRIAPILLTLIRIRKVLALPLDCKHLKKLTHYVETTRLPYYFTETHEQSNFICLCNDHFRFWILNHWEIPYSKLAHRYFAEKSRNESFVATFF